MKNVLILVGLFSFSFYLLIQVALLVVVFVPNKKTETPNEEKIHQEKTSEAIDENTQSFEQSSEGTANLVSNEIPGNLSNSTNEEKVSPDSVADAGDVQSPVIDRVKVSDGLSLQKFIETTSVSKATEIINKMDEIEAKEILRSIKKKQAAKILNNLDPEKTMRLLK